MPERWKVRKNWKLLQDILPYLPGINRSITGSGFKYVENTASDKEKEPLVLEPADEGVEGPGFGDGGEI